MKILIAVLAIACLSACSDSRRETPRASQAMTNSPAPVDFTDDELLIRAEWIHPQDFIESLFAVTKGKPEHAAVRAALVRTMDESVKRQLDRQSHAALRSKLESLRRGSNYHPWTREELEAALLRKEEKRKAKDAERADN